MNRFRNILCVVTDKRLSRMALERAVSLAENNQARLTAVSVMQPVSIGMGMPESGPISAELQSVKLREQTRDLDSLVEPFRSRITIQTQVLVGVQFLEIIREVLRNKFDLVIKSPEPGEWLDHLLGSEEMHLIRKCPCPIWLIKPTKSESFRRILAAVDVSDDYPPEEMKTRNFLNRLIIEMSCSLALADFAELHIVNAWQAIGENTMREVLLPSGTDFDVDAYVCEVRQQRDSALNQLLHGVSDDLAPEVFEFLKPQAHLVKGRARREIPLLAKRLKADLVVMGTVARTGIPGIITGNTAESILSQIDCSVLAIKPPGFKTPVTVV